MVQGYCLKEKKKTEIKNPVFELNARGTPVARGVCPSCGTKMYKILPADEVPADLKAKAEKFKKGGGSRKSRSSRGKSAPRKSRKSKSSRKSRSSRR